MLNFLELNMLYVPTTTIRCVYTYTYIYRASFPTQPRVIEFPRLNTGTRSLNSLSDLHPNGMIMIMFIFYVQYQIITEIT